MQKGYLNLDLRDGKILTVEYEQIDRTYLFDSDIRVRYWTVRKNIIRGTDYFGKPYLEFVITDKNGEERPLIYRCNQSCKEVGPPLGPRNDLSDVIRHFIENYKPFYQGNDWEHFPANHTICRIREIINNGQKAEDQLIEITKIINS